MSRLDLVVGPNGAGKSTFVEFVLAELRPGVPFVSADVIAAQRWPEDPVSHGHDASVAAAKIRDELLARGEPFVAETVASHTSKIDLVRRARLAGYHVHLLVIAVPEEFSVARVALRLASGGHDVPEDKIRARYRRLWDNVVRMIEIADSAEVFDNSGPGPTTVATFVAGEIVGRARWPEWSPTALTKRLAVGQAPAGAPGLSKGDKHRDVADLSHRAGRRRRAGRRTQDGNQEQPLVVPQSVQT